ncbi:GNAT family N-acetyltransferase [Pseudoxanthomonas sp. CF125]|uniref:GNAT family N-acetyltransferase n=1 Tax=Pseudoxanthomonas sp. CF125 TaxID=1855303 RepID=UPI00087E47A4|nr:GNAT family N-acetyltransferase [Pseudoxanthomonas sp. CF125]SDQ41221.1 Acetyltransferase (GNAT) domain-containing protein [Pseudoxanthomonas sp. CF125]
MGAHLHAHSADSSYQVRLESLPSLDELGVRWQELERRSRCSFFVSWRWIGPWLALIAPLRYARLLSVSRDERLVALGVITQRRRFLGLGPLHMRLHEVGDKVLDNLTIEYNGLVCEDGHEREALAAVLDHLAHNDKRWLTLYLPGMEADNVPFERIRSLDMGMRSRKHAAHYIDLTELRETGSDYLPTVLSSKARAAVRRTARKLQTGFGELSVAVAASAEEKLAFFRTMVQLHESHWSEEEQEHGAFGNPRILRFHERLIAQSGDGDGAQLIRVNAGDHTVGYVYNLIWRDTSYFYQAGIDYRRFGDCGSPGLLLLTRAVEHALANGIARFELMAGDSAYKRTLGMAENKMVWLSLDRNGWASALRRAWWRLQGRAQES